MQDFGILNSENYFFFNILLRILWQGINISISYSLTIINPKMVS